MRVEPTEIPDVLVLEPEVWRDERGLLFECYHRERFRRAGIDCEFVQDNHVGSVRHAVRGLHFQRSPGQAKLIRTTRGAVWDVAVDLRPSSASFGRWVARELSDDNRLLLFVPVGFAHGFAVLSDYADVQYKLSAPYDPAEEAGVRWDDPDLAVRWPVADPVLSERDRSTPSFRQLFPNAEVRGGA